MLLIVFVKGVAANISKILFSWKLCLFQELTQLLSFRALRMKHLHHLCQLKVCLWLASGRAWYFGWACTVYLHLKHFRAFLRRLTNRHGLRRLTNRHGFSSSHAIGRRWFAELAGNSIHIWFYRHSRSQYSLLIFVVDALQSLVEQHIAIIQSLIICNVGVPHSGLQTLLFLAEIPVLNLGVVRPLWC